MGYNNCLICFDCNVYREVGQRRVLWWADDYHERMREFLYDHKDHNIRFMEARFEPEEPYTEV